MIFHSAFEYSYLWLPLLGLVIGLLASMIGGGGGFFFPPLLILFFKVPAQIAVATSLAATLPICIVGAAVHYRNGKLDLNTGLIFGIAGILGALGGAAVTGLMTPGQLKTTFGIYSILLAILIMMNERKEKKEIKSKDNTVKSKVLKWIPRGSFYGFAGGVITGTFGTSGTAPVLAGLFAIKLPLKLVAGTSLMVIFINTVSALAGHLVLGVIDLTLVWFLTAGTVAGAIAGPKLTAGIKIGNKEQFIKQTFAYIVLAFGIILIFT